MPERKPGPWPNGRASSLPFAPYWIIIAILALVGAVLYARNVFGEWTPDRVAIHIEAVSFDIFWYGIIIIGGIALGTYVVAGLMDEKARKAFVRTVPAAMREQTLEDFTDDAATERQLDQAKAESLGDLIFHLGLNPERSDFKPGVQKRIEARLVAMPGFDETWLHDAPWRRWNSEHVWGAIAWCLIVALVGARLYHVLTPSPSMAEVGIESAADYFANPMQLVNIRSGGLGIFGGLVGGALALVLYARRHRLPLVAWADLAVIGLALGQAVGRWANFFNQELYGRPTEVPWALFVSEEHRISASSHYHPAFLYESLWSLATFLILMLLYRRYRSKLKLGDMTALYLLFYASGRILTETVRLDSRSVTIGPLETELAIATLISIMMGITAAAFLIWRHRANIGINK